MTDLSRLQTVLEIILYLLGSFGYSKDEIMARFQLPERTMYRYLNSIREAGIVLDHKNGYYRINRNEGAGKDLSDLLHFSEEEAWILSKAIHSIEDSNMIKKNLIDKLYSLYNVEGIARVAIKKEQTENIHAILEAIKTKRQIILKQYKSANSDEITDRIVEPVSFTSSFVNIWCYELESMQNKLFKTSRIGSVKVLTTPFGHEAMHKAGETDVFRISTLQTLPVKLRLSLRAASLLAEEYPLGEKYLTRCDDGKYIFETTVCSYNGVGRFVLGLSEDIEVLETPEFKDYLRKKMKKSKLNI